jgi:hypothetical protein
MYDPTLSGFFQVNMIRDWRKRVGQNQSEGDNRIKGKWKMGHGQGTKTRDVPDGLSKTYAISEVLGWDTEADIRGVWTSVTPGASTFSTLFSPNSAGSQDAMDHVIGCERRGIPEGHPLACRPSRDGRLVQAILPSSGIGSMTP